MCVVGMRKESETFYYKLPMTQANLAEEDKSVNVTLKRSDFMYYTWTLALERPVLPFFIYTFTALVLVSITGLWPAGRLYAFTVLIPLVGYTLFVWLSARGMWRRFPMIREPKRYVFKEKSYLLEEGGKKTPVAYNEVSVLTSRRGIYLLRHTGSADLLPKRSVENVEGLLGFLEQQTGETRTSNFL